MTRSEKLRVFMEIADKIGELSTCPRKAVGALIIRDGRAIAWGFNGAPPGIDHCAHPDDEPCERATHAEANSIAFAAKQGISTDNSIMLVSVSPCIACSRLIIAAGICEVYYREEYRLTDGIELLDEAGVVSYHVYDA